jgi:hypothetical protein
MLGRMTANKGKPTGMYAEKKTSPGRKGNYQRSGWPEDAPTQHVESGQGQQQGKPRRAGEGNLRGRGRGRNRKAGVPL